MNEVRKNFSKWFYWFLLAVAVILVYKFLDNFTAIGNAIKNFFEILTPFLAGTLIAYLLYIPAYKIEDCLKNTKSKFVKKHRRGISVFLTFLMAILLIIILANVILPVVVESIFELVNNFQGYWSSMIDRLNALPDNSILKDQRIIDSVKELGNSIQNIDLKQYLNKEKIIQYIKGAIGVASGIFSAFVTIVVSVYVLLQRTQIINFFRRLGNALFDEKTCNRIGRYFGESNRIFYRFISSQIIDGIVVGVMVTIAMSIIGVKYSVLLGFMIGLFNIIPYFGAIVAVIISIIITLITGGLSQALVMSFVVIILSQIDSNIINPKITGSSLQISPLLVIIAVTIGGAYFGVIGMFLGTPVIAVLRIVINDWIDYKIRKKYKKVEE